MRFILKFLASMAAAYAAAIQRDTSSSICFHISTVGGVAGYLGSVEDGKGQITDHAAEDFCIDAATGVITDEQGRGCFVDPESTQFLCEHGKKGTPGFSLGNSNDLLFDGLNQYCACPTETSHFKLYVQPVAHEAGCDNVQLYTSEHHAPTDPEPHFEQTACWHEYPGLIIPYSNSDPSKTLGNGTFGHIGGGFSTVYDFHLPDSSSGKTCHLEFLFPKADVLRSDTFDLSGHGNIRFSEVGGPFDPNNVVVAGQDDFYLDSVPAHPGTENVIESYPCTPGPYTVRATPDGDLDLRYFQNDGSDPTGLFVAIC